MSIIAREVAPQLVTVGASAGAIEALGQLLPALPSGFALPVLVVVHIPSNVRSLLPQLFADRSALRVREAEDKMPIEAGTITFCPADYHLLLESRSELALSIDGPVRFSRPSIDLLFQSAAEVFEAGVVGVVLSGANDDGARGLRAIREAGGRTLVQQPASAKARAMPEAALRAVPDSLSGDPSQLAALLRELGARLAAR